MVRLRRTVRVALVRSLILSAALLAAPLGAGRALAQDPGDMIVRLGRVETQMRQMAGQIEQLQFENRRLADQLRKFQEDVEFRLQEKGGGSSRHAPPARPQQKSDAFDPSANPTAAGAPQPLGATRQATGGEGAVTPSSRLPQGALATGGIRVADDEAPTAGRSADPRGPLDVSGAGGLSASPDMPAGAPRPGTSVASLGSANAREDYEGAYAFLMQRNYEQAEMGFRRFLQSHPRDRLAPDATYWLGESYYQRGRYREAAEQFLKVSTDYASSPVAPEAMMKLGASLNGMGAKAQACATLAEVERKYPSVSASVRQGIEREQKRARCAG